MVARARNFTYYASKASYDKDIEKSRVDSATCSKASYDKDLEKSCMDSATCSKASYRKESCGQCSHVVRPPMTKT